MKAVVCQNKELYLRDIAEPEPESGHVLVKVLRCGICGSDLHMQHHCSHMKHLVSRIGYDGLPSEEDPVVFGHEFCAEVLDYGPGSKKKIKPGTRVVAPPLIRQGDEIDMIGLSARTSGGYAERMILSEDMLMPVPNGLSSDLAALTEPMAIALHAVNRADIVKKDVAIIIGCGPVGLATIAVLKARGVKTIVASDFSEGRRALAKKCGADVVLDPAVNSPYSNWEEFGFISGFDGLLELGMSTKETLNKVPLPWWHVWRLAEALGGKPKRPVIFECVGVPGLINQVIEGAPLMSRIIVVGVCMEMDKFEPSLAIHKEIDLRFVLGYSPLEYRDSLHLIADGKLNCAPMITGVVGLEGVQNAFTVLGDAGEHAKILIDPALDSMDIKL